MKKITITVVVLLVSGCLLAPCVPVKVSLIRTSNGSVLGPDPRRHFEPSACVLVEAAPYEAWTKFGIGASVEVWECGCVS